MRKLLIILLAVVLTLGLSFVLLPAQPTMAGQTIYVDASNTTSPWDGTEANPYQNIQDGIDAATSGDTVQVAAGTYYENITLKDGVEVLGAGAGATTIDGGGSGSVVTATSVGSTTKIDGFTITNGNAYEGGGIYLDASSPTISHCIFSDNSANYGGGIFNLNSSPTVANCTFSGNSAYKGGGMYNRNYSSPTVTNCTFSGNSAYYGGGMYNEGYSSPTVTNCTFSGNSATHGGGMHNVWHSSPTVTNCILWDGGDEIGNRVSSVPVVTYCDIQWGYTGEGNIDADPLFVDPGTGDYHLQPGSPCIDTGSNSAPSLPTTDFEGDPRIWPEGGVVDMGADEYWVNSPPAADAGSDQTVEANTVGGANVTLDGSGSDDPDGDPLTYSWTWDGGSDSGVSPTVLLPLGTTTVTLVVNDGTVDSDPDTVDITVEDTTPPEVTANLIPIKIEENEGTCTLVYSVIDICDPNPTVTVVIELPFALGVDCEYKYKNGEIKVEGPSITLTVTAVDGSGNTGTAMATLEFTGEPG